MDLDDAVRDTKETIRAIDELVKSLLAVAIELAEFMSLGNSQLRWFSYGKNWT